MQAAEQLESQEKPPRQALVFYLIEWVGYLFAIIATLTSPFSGKV
jgi:hypothetical protein